MKENIEPTEDILSVEDARDLIAFIFRTNYQVMPPNNGPFQTEKEALAFVNSDDYKPEELLSVCFAISDEEGDAVFINRDMNGWWVDDGNMNGKSAGGNSIEEALRSYRNKFSYDAPDRPVELIVNQ